MIPTYLWTVGGDEVLERLTVSRGETAREWLTTKEGSVRLFKTTESAQRVTDKLNRQQRMVTT